MLSLSKANVEIVDGSAHEASQVSREHQQGASSTGDDERCSQHVNPKGRSDR
jgi:hypothetical protein